MKLNLALYKRAILTDSRKFIIYGAWMVMGAWLFIQLNTYVASMNSFGRGRGQNGLGFLWTLALVNFFFVTLAGVLGFSSSITEEKEEDCLGLLIMTGISPLNLLASKMLARYTRGLFLLMSQMPFIVLAVTLGGVSLQQVIAVYSVLISFMFMLCGLGTLMSLLFTKTGRAASVTFLLIVLYIIIVAMLRDQDIISWEEVNMLLPFIGINKIFTTGYSDYIMPFQFYGSIISGLFFFALTVLLFNKFALREASEKKKTKNRINLFKRGRAWHNALFWKEFNFNLSGRRGWLFQIFIYIFLVSILSYYSQGFQGENFIVTVLAFSALVFSSLILAVCASTMFSSEFREGTHTSLFTLPEELSAIFWSKLFGGFLYALPSLLLCVSLFLYILSENHRGPDFEGICVFLSFVLIYVILSGYLGLLMRIGSFIASAAILFIAWAVFLWLGLSRMGGDEMVLTIVVLNLISSTFIFVLARNKLLSMIAR